MSGFALDFSRGTLHDLVRPLRMIRRHAVYQPWRASSRPRVRARLEELFAASSAWLQSLGVAHWLTYGTLLGWHRDHDLIPGDLDVDFGLWARDFGRVWEARSTLPSGLRLFHTSHRHRGPKLYLELDGWEADLYFYSQREGIAQSPEESPFINNTAPFPACWIDPLQPARFLGSPTWVPANTEAFLRHMYRYTGRDGWRCPRTGYWYSAQ